jgi:hypothetical protein
VATLLDRLFDALAAHVDAAFAALSAGLVVLPQQAHQLANSPDT